MSTFSGGLNGGMWYGLPLHPTKAEHITLIYLFPLWNPHIVITLLQLSKHQF